MAEKSLWERWHSPLPLQGVSQGRDMKTVKMAVLKRSRNEKGCKCKLGSLGSRIWEGDSYPEGFPKDAYAISTQEREGKEEEWAEVGRGWEVTQSQYGSLSLSGKEPCGRYRLLELFQFGARRPGLYNPTSIIGWGLPWEGDMTWDKFSLFSCDKSWRRLRSKGSLLATLTALGE